MIKKCEFPGCGKIGNCRAPKDRELREYWHFCRAHAAEYNKSWNYYANMTTEEIEKDWEQSVFGPDARNDAIKIDAAEYLKFLEGFIYSRAPRVHTYKKSAMPSTVASALRLMDLPLTASWREVQTQYRKLAKLYHPDIAKRHDKSTGDKFATISSAHAMLSKYFKK